MGLVDAVDAGACAGLWRSDDPKLYTAALASLEAKQATKKTKYGDLNKLHAKWVALEKTLRKNGELTKKELQTVMSFKLTRGKMRPLMRFVDAADDGAVRSASRAALNALTASSSSADCGAAFGSMSLPGVGVATVSVIFAAADPRFAIMSDAALEACCGAPAQEDLRSRRVPRAARRARNQGRGARRRLVAAVRGDRALRREPRRRPEEAEARGLVGLREESVGCYAPRRKVA